MRPGEVCVLTKSLTTGVSGVPQSLSLDGMYRDTWAWSGRAGWRESALVGSFSGRSHARATSRWARPSRRQTHGQHSRPVSPPIDGQHTEEAKDHAAASSRSDRQVTRYLLGS